VKSTYGFKIYWLFLFFAILYSIQVLPRLSRDSLTNDEPAEITNGYYYLTQWDVWTPHLHPPLASGLTAFPLLALHLKTFPAAGDVIDRSHHFMFEWNLDQLSAITFWSRGVSWFFGLLIGLTLFVITRLDFKLCAAVLFFWALNPTFLGLAGVAKIEIIPVFFFLVAVLVFQRSFEKPNPGWFFLPGVLAAMAVTSKLYCLTLIPIFFILELAHVQQDKVARGAVALKRWAWGLTGFVSLIFLVYLPALLFSKKPLVVLGNLPDKFAEDFVFAAHPYPVYLFGRCTLESHWYYLPIAFLLKEPLPFIFILGFTLGLFLLKKAQIPSWQWMSAVIFFVAVLPTPNLGIRYLLPIYPFLFLIGAQGVVWFWNEGKQKKFFIWVLGGLLLWQTASVSLNFPHTLSYLNELVPPNRKLHYLADSNLDWGQDLIRLAQTARERNWGKVKLAYLGAVDPKVYGLEWEPFRDEDLTKPQPGTVYAVNASFYQLGPVSFPSTLPIVESWLNKTEPTGKVADSWYYFEIPGKRSETKNQSWLPSAPFLQYRGYCDYPINSRE
jgi:hypothetical protein